MQVAFHRKKDYHKESNQNPEKNTAGNFDRKQMEKNLIQTNKKMIFWEAEGAKTREKHWRSKSAHRGATCEESGIEIL